MTPATTTSRGGRPMGIGWPLGAPATRPASARIARVVAGHAVRGTIAGPLSFPSLPDLGEALASAADPRQATRMGGQAPAPAGPALPAPAPSLATPGHISESDLQAYQSGWASLPYEYDYYLEDAWVEGELPRELHGGTLFAAGPGLTQAYGATVRNPADADGMLWSLAIAPVKAQRQQQSGEAGGSGGAGAARAFFRNRFVRTGSFVAEQMALRRLSRGMHDRGAPAAAASAPFGLAADGAGSVLGALNPLNLVPEPLVAMASRAASAMAGPLLAERHTPPNSSSNSHSSSSSGGSAPDWLSAPLMLPSSVLESLMGAAEAAVEGLRGSAGALGPLFNPMDFRFRQTAGAGVAYVGGRLYALSEHALPHELNKTTLETVGQSSMQGLLDGTPSLVASWKRAPPRPGSSSQQQPATASNGQQQSSHLVLMTACQSGPDAALCFRELDAASGAVQAVQQYRVGGCLARFVTDFLVTENYYVVIQSPLSLNVERLASAYAVGDASFAECVDFASDQAARLHLIPRGRATGGAVVELPALVSPLGVQACEIGWGSDLVVVDVVAQQGVPFHKDMNSMVPGDFKGQPKPELTRIVVDAARRYVASVSVLSHRSLDWGAAPGPVARPGAGGGEGVGDAGLASVLFACASASEDRENWGPAQVVTKLRVPPTLGLPSFLSGPGPRTGPWRPASVTSEVWSPGPGSFLGPLLLVPKADGRGEEDVWLVTTVHTAGSGRGEIVVLDGAALRRGPVCSILLPHPLPYPRALTWVDRFLGPARAAPAAWKPGAAAAAPAAVRQ